MRRWIGCFSILILSIYSSDKESVIVSTVIPAHISGKQEEIKTMSVLTRLPISSNLSTYTFFDTEVMYL